VHQVQDWDAPATAIDWPRFIGFLRQVKANGEIPVDHRSYEDLNQNLDIPVSEAVASHWTQIFLNVREAKKKQNERVIWVLVDGFLMYYRPVSS
jgi:nicotinamide/nicotinate riboside kinase